MSKNEFEIFDVPLSRMKTIMQGDKRRYPFDMLEVGQGFALGKDCNRQSLHACKWKYSQQTGKKFVVRKIDGGPCCIRIA